MNTHTLSIRFPRWFPRLLLLAPLLALLLGLAGAQPVLAGDPAPPHVAGQIVAQLDLAVGATIQEINAGYGTTVLDQLTEEIYLLQAPAGADEKELADAMDRDLRLAFAELNYIGQTPEHSGQDSWAWGGPDSAPFTGQYALDALGLPPAHQLSQGAGTVVAVLDTGVDLDHPALAPHLTGTGTDLVDGDAWPDDQRNGLDDDGDGLFDEAAGHGTHVAGIVHLAAPQAQIMLVRVLDSDGQGNIYRLARGILHAADQGADVINLSLGLTEKSSLLKEVIRSATRQGVVVVAAAGNDNRQDETYPAATKCALSVTAVDEAGVKAPWANFGDWIAYAAPGEAIYSTFLDGNYAWWSGTSMATPFLAGQAALLLSLDPSLNVRQVALLIRDTAQPVDSHNPGLEGMLGAGQPNVHASLQRLQSGDIPSSNRGLISSSCIRNR